MVAQEIDRASHTFLFEPGTWEARGFFWDGKGQRAPAAGKAVIAHEPDRWTNDGIMRVRGETPFEFTSRYEIEPPDEGGTTMKWSSTNPAVGRLVGTFTVVGDTIISLYGSEDGAYWGTEHLTMIGPAEYQARGIFFMGDNLLSSWSVHLVRQQA